MLPLSGGRKSVAAGGAQVCKQAGAAPGACGAHSKTDQGGDGCRAFTADSLLRAAGFVAYLFH